MGTPRLPIVKTTDAQGTRLWIVSKLPDGGPLNERPRRQTEDWIQAKTTDIQKNLRRVLLLPSGGWYVLDAARNIVKSPSFYRINDHELVVWKSKKDIQAAAHTCPHMGAPLCEGTVKNGTLRCPWHGRFLGGGGDDSWVRFPVFNDGILTWVRSDAESPAALKPTLPPRPDHCVAGVIRFLARCEPADIIANRLDPWHGAHLHPHSFAKLRILDTSNDVLTIRVVFRIFGSIGIEVDCTFHCPEPRTIVMTIIAGEGAGSIVETHATPAAPGWTIVTEVTLATSIRKGFRYVRRLAAILRPLIEKRARKLWIEDAAYAERRYYLRNKQMLHDRGDFSPTKPSGIRRES